MARSRCSLVGLLDGRVAFITGVADGQGWSHAVRLAAAGADIIGVDALRDYPTITYRMGTQEDLGETVRLVEKAGRRMVARVADVRDRAALAAAVDDDGGSLRTPRHRVRQLSTQERR
jgi:NAD(P)-dependent dehydrogenase (short-subunit alcohol dehydrogenase family)